MKEIPPSLSAALALLSSITYRVAQKSKPRPNDKKSYSVVLKPVIDIRFIRQIKV